MSNTDSIYIYLLSNVNIEGQHVNNNVANFTTPLADPLILNEDWECGHTQGPVHPRRICKAMNKKLKAIKFRYWGEIIRFPFHRKLRFNPQSKKIAVILKGGELLHFHNATL